MSASNRRSPGTLLRSHHRRGYSLVEVVVAVMILLIGIVGVVEFIPPSLRAASESTLRGRAALLAQERLEELRRDANQSDDVFTAMHALPGPTAPLVFAQDSRMAYQFSPRSLLDGTDTTTDLYVVVRYAADFRPSAEILYELRFDR